MEQLLKDRSTFDRCAFLGVEVTLRNIDSSPSFAIDVPAGGSITVLEHGKLTLTPGTVIRALDEGGFTIEGP